LSKGEEGKEGKFLELTPTAQHRPIGGRGRASRKRPPGEGVGWSIQGKKKGKDIREAFVGAYQLHMVPGDLTEKKEEDDMHQV